jgi:hypothetical protein
MVSCALSRLVGCQLVFLGKTLGFAAFGKLVRAGGPFRCVRIASWRLNWQFDDVFENRCSFQSRTLIPYRGPGPCTKKLSGMRVHKSRILYNSNPSTLYDYLHFVFPITHTHITNHLLQHPSMRAESASSGSFAAPSPFPSQGISSAPWHPNPSTHYRA